MKRTGGKSSKPATAVRKAKAAPPRATAPSKARPSAKARPAPAPVPPAAPPATVAAALPVAKPAKPAPVAPREVASNGHSNGNIGGAPSSPPAPSFSAHGSENGARRSPSLVGMPAPMDGLDAISSSGALIAPIEGAPNAAQLVDDLASGKPTPMANAARVIEEWLVKRPEVLVPGIDRLIGCISSPHKRVAQTAALALPVMGRIAPARVARHLPALTEKFPQCTEIAKDGLVATFAALCTASVAYQKRLEPVLELALSTADPKTLLRWAEVILPSLKGEPHARARTVVEQRLPAMPRPQAQPIATFLGIKLRPLPV